MDTVRGLQASHPFVYMLFHIVLYFCPMTFTSLQIPNNSDNLSVIISVNVGTCLIVFSNIGRVIAAKVTLDVHTMLSYLLIQLN